LITSACSSNSEERDAFSIADQATLLQIAGALIGDSRLQVTHARLKGSCRALGTAAFPPPHAFASLFPAAVVLSTGDVQQAVGSIHDSVRSSLSTDLQQPGDASTGAYTHDAAVLEIDLSTSPAIGGNEQIVLSYLFGSEEYGSKNPNPDVLSISISGQGSVDSSSHSSSRMGSSGAETTDLAVLPGGSKLQPPSVTDGAKSHPQVFSNSGGRYKTVLNGFTQVGNNELLQQQE
jgi:hypothetical protein